MLKKKRKFRIEKKGEKGKIGREELKKRKEKGES
jgi:hypothetical protein